MDEIDYTKGIPNEPPEDIIPWLKSKGVFNDDYIVYKMEYVKNPLTGINEKMVRCKCTSCGEVFYMKYVKNECCRTYYSKAAFGFFNHVTDADICSGETTLCPNCKNTVKALHISDIGHGRMLDRVFPMTIHNVNGRLVLLTWLIERHMNKDGEICFFEERSEGYIVEKRKLIRISGYTRNLGGYLSFYGEWKQRKRFVDALGKQDKKFICPWDPKIMNGTSAENCKLDVYLKRNNFSYPISYMNLWVKHNNVENLIMQGADKLINEKLESLNWNYYHPSHMNSIKNIEGIDWKQNKPHLMLGLTKEEFKTAVKDKWVWEDIDFYKKSAHVCGIKLSDMSLCIKYSYYGIEDIFRYEKNVMKALRYIENQKKRYPENESCFNLSELRDYWDMMKKLGEDIEYSAVRYPKNLKEAHDCAVRRIEWKVSKELEELFNQRYKELERFNYKSSGLEIHPAKSQTEMINEGKILHHCVGRYAQSHAKGSTSIFFIRHSDRPEEPYFTLEYNFKSMKVMQNRGFENCSRTKEVKKFENEWVKFVKEVIKEEENEQRDSGSKKAA